MLVTNPTAPPKEEAKQMAERLARNLRAAGYEVRIDESIRSRYHVVVEVPFRMEKRTFAEREAAKEEVAR